VGHKYISFGGRIVLLNSVLNAIPYFLFVILEATGSSVEKDSADSKRILMGKYGRGKEDLLGEMGDGLSK